LICLKAQDYGSDRIAAIPLAAVAAAVERQVAVGPAAGDRPGSAEESVMPLLAPISIGELLDKITILEIKAEAITAPEKRANIMRELAALAELCRREVAPSPELDGLRSELRAVNRRLWDVEDAIRAHERDGRFDGRFIELARCIYRENDRRAVLKRRINDVTGSQIIEEKSHL
jgi:hypothetical protein